MLKVLCVAFVVLAGRLDAAGNAGFYSGEVAKLKQAIQGDTIDIAQLNRILDEARRISALPVVVRGESLEDLKNPGEYRMGGIDARTWNTYEKAPEKAEQFALAMSDTEACNLIARELPLVAAAYVLTGEDILIDYVTAQLEELTTWEPLQRPGWTLLNAQKTILAYGDGVWLATGNGLMAIYQTLQILPDGSLAPELTERIQVLARREAGSIRNDWEAKVPWYVRNQAVTSNQWVVPASGLITGSLIADLGPGNVCYELGVELIQQSFDALGEEGAVSEGFGYAMGWTTPFLALSALAAGDAGDDRLLSNSFLEKFPLWIVQSFQPGKSIVNCFDFYGGARNIYQLYADDISRLVVLTQDPYLQWLYRRQINELVLDVYGLLGLGLSVDSGKEPPLWNLYDRAHWFVWRSGWSEEDSGMWVRGRHPLDGHSHWDFGHVNFIVKGKPLLIEAATPGYNEPLKKQKYDSVLGHNTLQIGDDLYPERSGISAPIEVIEVTEVGGTLIVYPGAGYEKVSEWKRVVRWTESSVTITDKVSLKSPDMIRFRWHLASEQALQLIAKSGHTMQMLLPAGRIEFSGWIGSVSSNLAWQAPVKDIVETPEAMIHIEAPQPFNITTGEAPDHTMKFREWKHLHTLLEIESEGTVTEFEITVTFDTK